MSRRDYATDLIAVEWVLVEPYVRTSGYGRPPLHSKRELLNAIFYQLRAGSAWHLLPHDLPPWQLGLCVEVVRAPPGTKGFVVLPGAGSWRAALAGSASTAA